ncbi:FtsX-like permease family protein [Natronospirillum operosum]|uniref:FtsX-like permease family protein n=1 Tax=Natronospirillum operosum TaxID=2759953 RepID=A0A4Z0W8E0_9GAMM|nr:ABC transporter permease [Natronospirillum operosum]TGG90231.1 FtsX-like permease family protein [Natronospirillum operosum]
MRPLVQTLRALLAHWRRHPVQLAAWVVGLMLATALWSGVQALNTQARESYDRAAGLFAGAAQPMLVAREGETLTDDVFATLRQAGWPVSPLLEGRVRVGEQALTLVGIDPVTLPAEAAAASAVDQTGFELAAFLTRPGLTLAGPDTLQQLGVEPGAELRLASGALLPPLAVASTVPPGTLLVDVGLAQQLLQRPSELSRLLVADDPRWQTQALPEDLAERLYWQHGQSEDDLTRLTDSFHLNLTALGLLAFVVGLFIVNGATGLAFEQRSSLLRTLRACGVSGRQVVLALLFEVLLLALVAGLLGLLLGYGLAALLLPDVAASLQGLYGARVAGALQLEPRWWLAGLGMSLCGALLAAVGSLWQAARLPVLGLARREAWRAHQQRGVMLLALLGGGLWLLALGLFMAGSGLVVAFAGLAALLLGAALCLPGLLSVAVGIGQRLARGPVAEWFWAEARQQVSALSLALMALLLALAANIGVGSMVDSFRLTFTGWLDQRLAAEVYMNAEDAEQAEQMVEWLVGQPEIEAILPTGHLISRYADEPLELNGIRVHDTYRDHWPVQQQLADGWDRVGTGQAAMISEQMARRFDLAPGDSLTLGLAATPWLLQVAGIYADYGNPRAQMVVDLDALMARAEGPLRQGFSLRLHPDAAPQLVERARRDLGLEGTAVIDQASVRNFSEQVFERTFVATGALNTLTLGVAGVALLTSLLTLTQSRLPQLAPLWAQGLSRRHLAWLEWLRTLCLAGFTILLAVPLGLLLAWCLVAIINVEAFGWRLPLYLFPEQWLRLIGLAALTTVLATAWPLWRLGRQSPATWSKVFAHEQ